MRARRAIEGEDVLELVDVALSHTAVVVRGEDLARPVGAVGDDEADVEAEGRDLDLDQDPPAAPPATAPIAQAGEHAHILTGALETSLGACYERRGELLQAHVAAETDGARETVVLEPVVGPGGGKSGIRTEHQRGQRRVPLQPRTRRSSFGNRLSIERALPLRTLAECNASQVPSKIISGS